MRPEILVLDDDQTNARLIKMLLEMDGFNVTLCHNLTEAFSATHPSLSACVLDFHLDEGERGLDFLYALRRGETKAHSIIPAIVTTGDHRQSVSALEADADKFMLKPYPPSDLSKALKVLLLSDEEE